jgi:uncharacterized protein YndB with AHSA1/START domain
MPGKNDSIQLDLTIPATPDQIWEAWTNPEIILKWFGSDPKGWGVHAEVDLRVGGAYAVSFRDSNGMEHTCMGVYREIQFGRRVCFSWAWKAEPGVESIVTVTLYPGAGQTRMVFEHAGVGHASMHDYEKGWKSTFEKLQRLLSPAIP